MLNQLYSAIFFFKKRTVQIKNSCPSVRMQSASNRKSDQDNLNINMLTSSPEVDVVGLETHWCPQRHRYFPSFRKATGFMPEMSAHLVPKQLGHTLNVTTSLKGTKKCSKENSFFNPFLLLEQTL